MRTFNAYNPKGEETINVPSYTPVMNPDVKMFPKYLRANGYYTTNNAKEDYNFEKTVGTWDESSTEAHFRKRKEGQPFFSVFNFGVCHESGIWRMGEDSLFVNPEDVWLPPYFPDNETVRHDIAVNYSNLKRADSQIASIINQLKEDGEYDNSYIFFYGDHGGPFPRHKRSVYDSGIKVPLTVKLPKDLNPAGGSSRSDEIVSFVDLAPTVLSIAGMEKPSNMQGQAFLGKYKGEENEFVFASSDRFDEVYDRKRTVRNKKYKYIKNYKTEVPYALPVSYREQMPMMRNLRELNAQGALDENQKLWMRDVKEEEEFYDIVNDPFEVNNLINDQSLSGEISNLREALNDWMDRVNDLGGEDEQDLIKRWADEKQENILSPPVLTESSGSIQAENPGEYGTIVFKLKSEDNWKVYDEPVKIEGDQSYIFKIVHKWDGVIKIRKREGV